MILPLRALVRLVAFVLLTLLSLVGLAVAAFCLQGGSSGLSLSNLSSIARLPELHSSVDQFLTQLKTPGPIDAMSILGGAVATVLGLLLLIGALARRHERVIVISDGESGRVTARRRPLAKIAAALVEQVRGVTEAKVRVKSRHGKGGRLRVCASHSRRVSPREVKQHAKEALVILTENVPLKTRLRVRFGSQDARAQ